MLTNRAAKFFLACVPLVIFLSLSRTHNLKRQVLSTIVDSQSTVRLQDELLASTHDANVGEASDLTDQSETKNDAENATEQPDLADRSKTKDDAGVADAPGDVREDSKPRPSAPCAILFVGLPRSYKSLVLPSIIKNVIPYNRPCDYFVHSYNKTHEAAGRSGAGGEIDPTEIFLLRDAIHAHNANSTSVNFLLETEAQFTRARKQVLNKLFTEKDSNGTLIYVPDLKSFADSSTTENIVKQWHSIQSAWQLMEQSEKERGQNYTTVAVLRSDVVFVAPIKTQDYQEGVFVPGFALFPVNDRLIYGNRMAVEIWANQRFDRMENHVYNHLGFGIHPERFLNWTIFPAIRDAGFSVTEHPSICLLRARAEDVLWANDCYDPNRPMVSPEIEANYKDKNMKSLVQKTLGRSCIGRGWNNRQKVLKCPPKTSVLTNQSRHQF